MPVRPWLQLVRLPNLFTAAADPLAGFLLGGAFLRQPEHYLPLMLAGASIYAGGMVLNDRFDLELDRRERPERPLPSGRISTRSATILGVALLVVGPLLASLGPPRTWIVATALSACVLAYDAFARRFWIGPIVMGTCRMLNLAMGLHAGRTVHSSFRFLDPETEVGILLGYALLVAGITWISRTENHDGRTPSLALGLALLCAALLGLFGTLLRNDGFRSGALLWSHIPRDVSSDLGWARDHRGIGSLVGISLLIVTISVIATAGLRVWRSPRAALKRAAVRTGVLSLVWILSALVFAVCRPPDGLAVAALAIPARLLARRFPPT